MATSSPKADYNEPLSNSSADETPAGRILYSIITRNTYITLIFVLITI